MSAGEIVDAISDIPVDREVGVVNGTSKNRECTS